MQGTRTEKRGADVASDKLQGKRIAFLVAPE
jgi:hypothetical protein